MGSSPSKNGSKLKQINDLYKTESLGPIASGYPAANPPLYYIDDIKSPIGCYNQHNAFDDDGFDWSEILDKSDSGHEMADFQTRPHPFSHKREVGSVVVKQPVPSTKRPIRSITLLGREKTGHPSKQTNDSSSHRRTPTLKRRSTTPGAFTDIPKLDFSKIDLHAQRATDLHRKSYENLLGYILGPIRDTNLQEIMTARVLIVWLANQPLKKSFSKPNDSTPDGLLQMIAEGSLSYAAAYTSLCRAADLKCVLIEGVSKVFTYTPSESITKDMDDVWTAVYCEGSWQFVHPDRICRTQDETIKREFELTLLLDDLFMPAPEYFIHTCYPDEDTWQLLRHECIIRSRVAFLQIPCIFPAFFKLGLKLESDTSSIISSGTGKCDLDLICSHTNDNRFSLICKMTMIGVNHGTQSKNRAEDNFDNFVLNSRQNHQFHIEVKLPFEGSYKLEIFQCFYGVLNIRLCNFTLISTKTMQNVTQLPFSPKHMMWGPGFMCDEAGLLVPSQMVGVIVIHPKNIIDRRVRVQGASNYKTARFVFILQPDKTKEFEMFAYLRRSNTSQFSDIVNFGAKRKTSKAKTDNEIDESAFYSNFVSCERDDEKQTFAISVLVPHDGEYGLLITKRHYHLDKNKMRIFDAEEQAVCAYLIRASRNAHGDNAHQRLARDNMVSLIYREDHNRLSDAIDKCRKVNINVNDGDIFSAEMWAEYLKHKNDLNESLHRRNIRHIDNILIKVSRFRYKAALHFKVNRVFQLRHQLVQLRALRKYTPSLGQAAAELASISVPVPAPVHATMAAVLLMFGEIDKKLEDWSFIRKQIIITNGEEEPPLLRKIHLVAEICPSKNATNKIMSLLTEYSDYEIHAANQWAVCFNCWAMKVLSVFDQSIDVDGISLPDTTGYRSSQPFVQIEKTNRHKERSEALQEVSEEALTEFTEEHTGNLAFNTVFDIRTDVLDQTKSREERGVQTGRDDIGIQTD